MFSEDKTLALCLRRTKLTFLFSFPAISLVRQVKTIKAALVLPGQAMPADGVPDMVVLENLHEASILECVDRRFRKNLIYVRGVCALLFAS